METRGLTKSERLRLRRDFDKVFSEGRSVADENLRIVYVENGLDIRRIAVVVRKRIGKAVFRNRLRRLIKEVFRLNKEYFPNGMDYVFVVREGMKDRRDIGYWEMEKIIKRLLEKLR